MKKFNVNIPIPASVTVEVEFSEEAEQALKEELEEDELDPEDLEEEVKDLAEKQLRGHSLLHSFNIGGKATISIDGELDWEECTVDQEK